MLQWMLRHGSSILIFAGGGIAAYSAFVSERRASGQRELRRRGIWPSMILTGALMGGGGPLWAGYQQDRFGEYLSGGNSYVYFMPVQLTSKTLQFTLVQRGENPVYDIMVDVSDVTMWRKLWLDKGWPAEALDPKSGWKGTSAEIPSDDIWEMRRKTVSSLSLGNIGPGSVRFAWEAPVPAWDDQRYQFSIWARNGMVTEQILMHRGPSGWVSAWRIARGDPATNGGWDRNKIDEYVMPGFPPDKVKWD